MFRLLGLSGFGFMLVVGYGCNTRSSGVRGAGNEAPGNECIYYQAPYAGKIVAIFEQTCLIEKVKKALLSNLEEVNNSGKKFISALDSVPTQHGQLTMISDKFSLVEDSVEFVPDTKDPQKFLIKFSVKDEVAYRRKALGKDARHSTLIFTTHATAELKVDKWKTILEARDSQIDKHVDGDEDQVADTIASVLKNQGVVKFFKPIIEHFAKAFNTHLGGLDSVVAFEPDNIKLEVESNLIAATENDPSLLNELPEGPAKTAITKNKFMGTGTLGKMTASRQLGFTADFPYNPAPKEVMGLVLELVKNVTEYENKFGPDKPAPSAPTPAKNASQPTSELD